jgi:hypothetical protein
MGTVGTLLSLPERSLTQTPKVYVVPGVRLLAVTLVVAAPA